MRYQQFITERKDPGLLLKGEFRSYYMPVAQREGGWFPAGDIIEDTDSHDQVGLLSDIITYQIFRYENDVGSLDDIQSPDDGTVAARIWLPDDYKPPTPEELAQRRRESIQKLKDMGLWRES